MQPVVGILSEPHAIARTLCKNLLARGCRVVTVGDKSKWTKALLGTADSESVKSIGLSDSLGENLDYLFSLSGFLGEDTAKIKDDVSSALTFVEKNKAKTLFVFPFSKKDVLDSLVESIPSKSVFLGETYGPGMEFVSEGPLARFFYQMAEEDKVYLPASDFELLGVYIPDAVEEIIRTLFSYGFSGKSIVISQKTTAYKFLGEIGKVSPETIFIPDSGHLKVPNISGVKFVEPRKNTKESLTETVSWIRSNRLTLVGEKHSQTKARATEITIKKIGEGNKKEIKKATPFRFKFGRKAIVAVISLFFLTLTIPYISLFASFGLLKLSLESYAAGKSGMGGVLISASDYVSTVSHSSSSTAVNIPLLGELYIFAADGSILVREALVVGKRSIATMSLAKTLIEGVISDTDYDLNDISHKLATNSELIYQDLSFLQSEIDRMPQISSLLNSRGISLSEYRELFLHGVDISKSLPTLLGMERAQTYLFLFQNNMELRPTGGFIGSFALVTFDRGKLADVEFFDVYTADGQLKGHVEPPEPIRDHLGEANWYLRDSNWDPDFRVSAERAEWFLDKELERSVDGVVGIDVEVVRDLLKVLGPVRIADLAQEVDYKSVYEKVQYEVENNFFPGSQKKTNVLTGLGKAILERIREKGSINHQEIAKVVYSNFQRRHIQIFVHDPTPERAFSELNFTGEVLSPVCAITNCTVVTVGLVEANVGVNKVNYFIDRSVTLNSFVNDGKIENVLTVEYKNNAPQALGISGRYKNYVRLLINGTSNFKEAGVVESGGTKSVTPDIVEVSGRREVGVLVDIPAGAKKSVRYSWSVPASLNFGANGQVKYLIRKQAGTSEDALLVKIVPPSGVAFKAPSVYNTHLVTDFTSSVEW